MGIAVVALDEAVVTLDEAVVTLDEAVVTLDEMEKSAAVLLHKPRPDQNLGEMMKRGVS
jgi:hypothetical protein